MSNENPTPKSVSETLYDLNHRSFGKKDERDEYIERLEEELAFYADESNWRKLPPIFGERTRRQIDDGAIPAHQDKGARARLVLQAKGLSRRSSAESSAEAGKERSEAWE